MRQDFDITMLDLLKNIGETQALIIWTFIILLILVFLNFIMLVNVYNYVSKQKKKERD